MKTKLTGLLFLLVVAGTGWPTSSQDLTVRRIPPAGVAIAPDDHRELTAGVEALNKEVDELRSALKDNPALLDLLPDVQIYANAVRYALQHDEFLI